MEYFQSITVLNYIQIWNKINSFKSRAIENLKQQNARNYEFSLKLCH